MRSASSVDGRRRSSTWRSALADLALPVSCPGCGAAAIALCRECAAALQPRPRQVHPPSWNRAAPVLCAADYTSTASRVVVAWKDRGRLDLTPVLVRGLAVSVAGALAVLGDPAPIQLVPVASTASAVRRRQDDVVARLARGAADLVRAGPGPPRVRVTPVLALRRGVADAAGLAAHERRRNLDGRVRLRAGSAALVHGHGVLLVDDVVTTGASAATSAEVLEAAGARVLGVCVVCATPRRARARPGLSGPFEVV